jgi:hypothetical protein
VGDGQWIGRISVPVSATSRRNFRRDATACASRPGRRNSSSYVFERARAARKAENVDLPHR